MKIGFGSRVSGCSQSQRLCYNSVIKLMVLRCNDNIKIKFKSMTLRSCFNVLIKKLVHNLEILTLLLPHCLGHRGQESKSGDTVLFSHKTLLLFVTEGLQGVISFNFTTQCISNGCCQTKKTEVHKFYYKNKWKSQVLGRIRSGPLIYTLHN